MAESVVAFVAGKLSCRSGAAEKLLRGFASDLRRQAKEEGRVTINGLGTFTASSSELAFVPDEALLSAAWAALDGLEPVMVVSGKESAAELTADEALSQTSAGEAAPPDLKPEVTGGPAGTESRGDGPSAEEDARTSADTGPSESSRPPGASLPRRPARPTRRPKPRWRWPVAILGMFIVGAALVLLLDFEQFEPQDPPGQHTIIAGDPTLTGPAGSEERLGPGANPLPNNSVAQEAQDSVGTKTEAGTDLPPQEEVRSQTRLDRNQGGYTLIVASFEDRAVAASEVDRTRMLISSPGIPVDIMRSRDGTKFRVTVGQQPTIEDALSLREQLTMLPSSTWVLRITADS